MNLAKRYIVYFQGEEESFLNVNVENYEKGNIYQLFEGFLNEFANSDKTFAKYDINNTQLYFLNEETNELVTNLNVPIPDNYSEYIIRPKIPVNDPVQRVDQNVTSILMDRATVLAENKDYFGSLFLYHNIKEQGILEMVKIYYKLKDWNHLLKYIDSMKLHIRDPYINEILGYTYENTNNKIKAYETFSIFKDTEAIQKVACARLYYQIPGMGKIDTTKSSRVNKKEMDDKSDKFNASNEPVNESVDKPVDESVDKPVNESVDKPVNESVDKPVDESVDKPVDESVDKPVDESGDKSNKCDKSDKSTDKDKKYNKTDRVSQALARKKAISRAVNEANTIIPRDIKIYAREMIDTLLQYGLTAKALTYFYTNFNYFDAILPMMCSSRRSAKSMFVRFRSCGVNRYILMKVCSALMGRGMIEQSLDLARFVYSHHVNDPEYAYILMHLYFLANMKEEIINTFFITFNCYQSLDRFGTFRAKEIRRILSANKEFSKYLTSPPLGEPMIDMWRTRPDYGPKCGLDFYRFFFLFFISLLLTKNKSVLEPLIEKLALSIRTVATDRDELKSAYQIILHYRFDNVNEKSTRDIYVFGDIQGFMYPDISCPVKTLNASFYPLAIGQVSLWKLYSSKHNSSCKKIFAFQLQKISKEDIIILSFGKRDCKKYIPKFVMRNRFQSLTDACSYFAELYVKVAESVRISAPKAKIAVTAPFSRKTEYLPIFVCFSTELEKILPKHFAFWSVFKEKKNISNQTHFSKTDIDPFDEATREIVSKYFKELID